MEQIQNLKIIPDGQSGNTCRFHLLCKMMRQSHPDIINFKILHYDCRKTKPSIGVSIFS